MLEIMSSRHANVLANQSQYIVVKQVMIQSGYFGGLCFAAALTTGSGRAPRTQYS